MDPFRPNVSKLPGPAALLLERAARAPKKLRSVLRDVAGDLLFASGLTRPERAAATRLTVVTFHRVLPVEQLSEYPIREIAVSVEEFDWFLDFFGRFFECGSLARSVARWGDGTGDRPPLAITFDDGQRDNYDFARPLLEKHGMRATFYVPVEAVETNATLWHDRLAYAAFRVLREQPGLGRRLISEIGVTPSENARELAIASVEKAKALPAEERVAFVSRIERAIGGEARPPWDGMMSWEQLRTLVESGHEVGSHSMSHSILPLCTAGQLEYEIGDSRRILTERLGVAPTSFCYPNGDHDDRSIDCVRRAGYERAVTTRWGPNDRAASPYALSRCDIQGQHARSASGELSQTRLAWRLSGLYPGLD